MDDLNVQTAVLPISLHFGDASAAAELARRVNDEGTRIRAAHPGRFGLFASTPVRDVDASIAELRYALDALRANGIVLETNNHGVYLGDASRVDDASDVGFMRRAGYEPWPRTAELNPPRAGARRRRPS
jgi:hypothetical protein